MTLFLKVLHLISSRSIKIRKIWIISYFWYIFSLLEAYVCWFFQEYFSPMMEMLKYYSLKVFSPEDYQMWHQTYDTRRSIKFMVIAKRSVKFEYFQPWIKIKIQSNDILKSLSQMSCYRFIASGLKTKF